jgi:hypothetical protein
MKKIFILTGVVALVLSASCDLDKYPATGIAEGVAFQTMTDAASYHYGFYVALRSRVYGIYCYSGDVQSDLFNASADYGNRNGSVYNWTFISDDYSIRDVWQNYYSGITQLNFFLDNADQIVVEAGSADEKTLNNYKGEAHLLRAYYYHQLVKYYAKAYDVNGVKNGGELGVPIVDKYDVEAKPSRSTLEDTYQFILGDIAAAKTLLTVAGEAGSEYLTVDAITALEARVQLSLGNWVEAAAAANSLITGGKYPLVNTAENLRKVWHKGDKAESIVQLYAALSPAETAAANNIYLGDNGKAGAEKRFAPDFIPAQWTLNLYDNADIRKQVFLQEKNILLGGSDDKLVLFNKFPGDSTLFTVTTNYQHKPKVFRIAEMYLIKAEALAHSPATEGEALATLNILRTNRGLNALTGLSGTGLLDEIKRERTRELLGEGNRLDDLKRWNQSVDRAAGGWQKVNLLAPGNAEQLVKQAGNDKFVWAIPYRDMTANPNLAGQQNPGW